MNNISEAGSKIELDCFLTTIKTDTKYLALCHFAAAMPIPKNVAHPS